MSSMMCSWACAPLRKAFSVAGGQSFGNQLRAILSGSATRDSVARRCHRSHRFSRRPGSRSYRNLIKTSQLGRHGPTFRAGWRIDPAIEMPLGAYTIPISRRWPPSRFLTDGSTILSGAPMIGVRPDSDGTAICGLRTNMTLASVTPPNPRHHSWRVCVIARSGRLHCSRAVLAWRGSTGW